jgi:hypothetical protein
LQSRLSGAVAGNFAVQRLSVLIDGRQQRIQIARNARGEFTEAGEALYALTAFVGCCSGLVLAHADRRKKTRTVRSRPGGGNQEISEWTQ